MSISYNQLDDSHPGRVARHGKPHDPTEWEKRKTKAEKALEDAVDIAERRASLSGSERGSVKKNLSRKSAPAMKDGPQISPRGKSAEKATQDLFSAGSASDDEGGEHESTKMPNWWKRTDSANLNRKPDGAIADEATNTQFKNYSYKPQYDVSGVYCPEYFKSKDSSTNTSVVSH